MITFKTAWADAGVDPIDFPIAPTVALPQALKKANLTVEDIALFEINEAFSVVVRIAEKVLNIDPAKVNVNGYVYSLLPVHPNLMRIFNQGCCLSRACHWKLWLADHRFSRTCPQIRRVRGGWYLQWGKQSVPYLAYIFINLSLSFRVALLLPS